MSRSLIDCHACGGQGRRGCGACRGSGTTMTESVAPPADFTVSVENFDEDREACPCYEGIKINDGVDQCTHPDRLDAETWCESHNCPLLWRQEFAQADQAGGEVKS